MEIDHRDRQHADNNKWANLRPATAHQQRLNVGLRKDNKTGYKGVFLDNRSGKFCARIKTPLRSLRTHLGYFDTPEEAGIAYKNAAERYLDPEFRVVPNLPEDCSTISLK